MMKISNSKFWNGIDLTNYKMKIIMNGSCSTLEDITENQTIQENFKYKDLENKLNEYFNKYDKILLDIRFGDLKRRFKTLTEKLNCKIERTTYYDETTETYERVYVVITKDLINLDDFNDISMIQDIMIEDENGNIIIDSL